MGAVHSLIVGVVVWLVVGRIALRLTPRDDPRLQKVVKSGLALKLLATPVQFFVVDHLYGGTADANGYYHKGVHLANALRTGHFTYTGGIIGDGATIISVAVVLALIGTTKLGAALAFSGLAFVGVCYFYRAFVTGVPEGNQLRYARLVFFFPSIVFWTATFSKESIMILGLGLAAFGAARLLSPERGGWLATAGGLGVCTAIRPHIALLVVAGAVVAYLFRRPRKPSPLSPFAKLLGIGILVGGGLLLASTTASFVGVTHLDTSSVQQVLKDNQANLQAGGGEDQTSSSFQEKGATSPWNFPNDVVTVLFRPFPFEAHNTQELGASIEGLVIFFLLLVSLSSLVSALRAIRRTPYIVLAVVYSAAFIYVFASVTNFGLLNRERIQLIPFLLVLLALPSKSPTRRPRGINRSWDRPRVGRIRGVDDLTRSVAWPTVRR